MNNPENSFRHVPWNSHDFFDMYRYPPPPRPVHMWDGGYRLNIPSGIPHQMHYPPMPFPCSNPFPVVSSMSNPLAFHATVGIKSQPAPESIAKNQMKTSVQVSKATMLPSHPPPNLIQVSESGANSLSSTVTSTDQSEKDSCTLIPSKLQPSVIVSSPKSVVVSINEQLPIRNLDEKRSLSCLSQASSDTGHMAATASTSQSASMHSSPLRSNFFAHSIIKVDSQTQCPRVEISDSGCDPLPVPGGMQDELGRLKTVYANFLLQAGVDDTIKEMVISQMDSIVEDVKSLTIRQKKLEKSLLLMMEESKAEMASKAVAQNHCKFSQESEGFGLESNILAHTAPTASGSVIYNHTNTQLADLVCGRLGREMSRITTEPQPLTAKNLHQHQEDQLFKNEPRSQMSATSLSDSSSLPVRENARGRGRGRRIEAVNTNITVGANIYQHNQPENNSVSEDGEIYQSDDDGCDASDCMTSMLRPPAPNPTDSRSASGVFDTTMTHPSYPVAPRLQQLPFHGGGLRFPMPTVASPFQVSDVPLQVSPMMTENPGLVDEVLREDPILAQQVMALVLARLPALSTNPVGLRFFVFRELMMIKNIREKKKLQASQSTVPTASNEETFMNGAELNAQDSSASVAKSNCINSGPGVSKDVPLQTEKEPSFLSASRSQCSKASFASCVRGPDKKLAASENQSFSNNKDALLSSDDKAADRSEEVEWQGDYGRTRGRSVETSNQSYSCSGDTLDTFDQTTGPAFSKMFIQNLEDESMRALQESLNECDVAEEWQPVQKKKQRNLNPTSGVRRLK